MNTLIIILTFLLVAAYTLGFLVAAYIFVHMRDKQSFFDMPRKEQEEIINKAAEDSNKAQQEIVKQAEEKPGPISRPDTEKLDRKANPRKAEEDDAMSEAIEAMFGNTNNTMQMKRQPTMLASIFF